MPQVVCNIVPPVNNPAFTNTLYMEPNPLYLESTPLYLEPTPVKRAGLDARHATQPPQPDVDHDGNGSPRYATLNYADVHTQPANAAMTANPMYQSAGMRPNQMFEAGDTST